MISDLKLRSEAIKAEAHRLGFDDCGIARAEALEEEKAGLLSWLQAGYQAGMTYMERNHDKRTDPRQLVDGARSVIVLLQNYFPAKTTFNSRYKIAKYAYGEDYHYVLKEKLFTLFQYIDKEISPVRGRCFTDSAPVMERTWAVKAGLGWIGKNGNLLTRNHGSFVFIAELIIDLELEYDSPNFRNYCGSCTLCIDHCPTGAIVADKVIDSRKCISYLTIENKSNIPDVFKGKTEDWIFGCDICQDVCPWNRKNKPTTEERFHPAAGLVSMHDKDWENLSREDFDSFFRKSPVIRPGFNGMRRNIENCSDDLA